MLEIYIFIACCWLFTCMVGYLCFWYFEQDKLIAKTWARYGIGSVIWPLIVMKILGQMAYHAVSQQKGR